jgi:hypothetical protein
MNESDIIERLIAFRREISEIREENRIYWTGSAHSKLEMEYYEKRLERLDEIRKELPVSFLLWFGSSLPKMRIHFKICYCSPLRH